MQYETIDGQVKYGTPPVYRYFINKWLISYCELSGQSFIGWQVIRNFRKDGTFVHVEFRARNRNECVEFINSFKK